MKANKSLIRILSFILVTCLALGCTGHDRVVLPKDASLSFTDKVVVLHRGADTFYLADVKVTDEFIDTFVDKIRAKPRTKKSQELHIYSVDNLEIPASLPAQLSIPFDAIEKIEVYNVSTEKTITYNVLGGLGITVLVLAIIIGMRMGPTSGVGLKD